MKYYAHSKEKGETRGIMGRGLKSDFGTSKNKDKLYAPDMPT